MSLAFDAAPALSGDEQGLQIGRVTIIRETALPYWLLDLQAPTELEQLTEALLHLDGILQPLRERLAEALHVMIPGLDSAPRKVALALKRGMFNNRLNITTADARALFEDAPGPLRGDLETWLPHVDERSALLARGRAAYDVAHEAAVDRMIRQALELPQFRNGLALTAPGLLARAGDLDKGGKRARYARKKLAKYVIRTANKTAPLNQLAALSLLVDGIPITRTLEVEARPAQDVIRRVVRRRLIEGRSFWINETMTWSGDVCAFWGVRAGHDGRVFPGQQHLPWPPACAEALRSLTPGTTIGAAALRSRLRAIGDAAAVGDVLEALLTSRALIPLDPDGLGATVEEAAAQLERVGAEGVADATRRLSSVLADTGLTAIERAKAVEAFKTAVGVESRLNGDGEGSAAYETLWRPSPIAPEVISANRDVLDAFLRSVPEHLEVTPIYAWLLRQFIRRFGSGGSCANVFGWLQTLHLEGASTSRRGPMSGEHVTAPLGLTLYYGLQRAQPSSTTYLHCQAIHCHVGWQLGRFAFGGGASASALRTALRVDIAAFAAPAIPVTLAIDSDSHNIQANPALFEPVITFPGQVPAARRLAPGTLSATHDPATNRIHLYAEGLEVRPIYNGGMLPFPHLGLPFLLLALADPFRMRPFAPPPSPPEARRVTHSPRRFVRDVMVARGHWWIPGEMLAGLAGETGFDRSVELRRIWEAHNLPTCAYACGFSAKRDLQFVNSTPNRSASRWVDIRVSSSADFLTSLLGYDWVLLQENSSLECLGLGDFEASGRAISLSCEAYYRQISRPLPH